MPSASVTRNQYNAVDLFRTKYMLIHLIEEPGDIAIKGSGDSTYENGTLFKALAFSGITRFNSDFLGSSVEDIMMLTLPPEGDDAAGNPNTAHTPIPRNLKRKLLWVLSFYHATCQKERHACLLETMHKSDYEEY